MNTDRELVVFKTSNGNVWRNTFSDCIVRYLDDVALHHLIDALCKLSSEAMDVGFSSKVGNMLA